MRTYRSSSSLAASITLSAKHTLLHEKDRTQFTCANRLASKRNLLRIAPELLRVGVKPLNGSARIEEPEVLCLPLFLEFRGVWKAPEGEAVVEGREDDSLSNKNGLSEWRRRKIVLVWDLNIDCQLDEGSDRSERKQTSLSIELY